MFAYIVQRLITTVFVLFAVVSLVFLILRVVPGDPATLIAGPQADFKDIELIRQKWGLERPIYVQYLTFWTNLVRGDLGRSWRTHRPVAEEVLVRFPATVQLATASTIVAVLIGTLAGLTAALRPHSFLDNITMVFALLGISTPNFLRALLLVLLFAVTLGWLPVAGRGSLVHLILPAVSLGIALAGLVARMLRSGLLEVLSQDYIRTARAKGLNEWSIIWRHALKNAAIPTVTVVGVQFGALLAGAVVTETIFSWPGVGRLMIDSINSRDYPTVQGAVILFAATVALVNLLVDLLYSLIDPRIRYS